MYELKCKECGKMFKTKEKRKWYCPPCKAFKKNERHTRNANSIFRD